jgi:glycosyltransferase involved in cell wall biosynthesis
LRSAFNRPDPDERIVRILIAHNFYQQRGGEDLVFEEEAQLLESRGHEVLRYTAHNDAIDALPRVTLALRTIWNHRVHTELRELIGRTRPAVMHVHNTLPLLSPAVYHAARAERVPVVQTLHNYRQVCPAATCFRDGRICTDCVGRSVPLPAVWHACYRTDRMASAVVAAMLSVHRLAGTWRKRVDMYIAPSAMTRELFVKAGLPPERIVVKPNFVAPDPGPGRGTGGYVLFVGRLAVEKGLHTLLDAWRLGHLPELRIVGDGPLAPVIAAAAASLPHVRWLAEQERGQVLALLRDATCLVFPSEWYETFGRVIIEAFAAGTPVIAAAHGAAVELVEDGSTGLHFRPGDSRDLVEKVKALTADTDRLSQMRLAARRAFELRYTAEANYRMLLDIYEGVLAGASSVRA